MRTPNEYKPTKNWRNRHDMIVRLPVSMWLDNSAFPMTLDVKLDKADEQIVATLMLKYNDEGFINIQATLVLEQEVSRSINGAAPRRKMLAQMEYARLAEAVELTESFVDSAARICNRVSAADQERENTNK